MEAKEKAIELVDRFYQDAPELFGTSKAMEYAVKCALIAVDEILILITAIDGTEYWQEFYEEVKQEIEKL